MKTAPNFPVKLPACQYCVHVFSIHSEKLAACEPKWTGEPMMIASARSRSCGRVTKMYSVRTGSVAEALITQKSSASVRRGGEGDAKGASSTNSEVDLSSGPHCIPLAGELRCSFGGDGS